VFKDSRGGVERVFFRFSVFQIFKAGFYPKQYAIEHWLMVNGSVGKYDEIAADD